jgi:hypothetical protein
LGGGGLTRMNDESKKDKTGKTRRSGAVRTRIERMKIEQEQKKDENRAGTGG